MNEFVESILASIAECEPDAKDGIRRVATNPFAVTRGKSVFLHSTDDVCALIADPRVPWAEVRVTTLKSDAYPRSLLSTVIQYWAFDSHLDFDDKVLDALVQRFEPVELCQHLSRSHAQPISPINIGGGVDQSHILLERLGIIVASSPALINAWVDAMFVEIKYRDKVFSTSFFESFTATEKHTRLYRQLDPDISKRDRLPLQQLMSVMVMAAAFEPEAVKSSMARYTPTSLYTLSRGTLTGYIDDDMNPIRMSFMHALYLLGEQANDAFVRLHITKDAVTAGSLILVPSLICVMASVDKPHFSLRSLVGPAADIRVNVVREFAEYYLFRWRDGLSVNVLDEKRNAALRRALRNDQVINHLFSARLFARTHTDDQQARHVEHYRKLPADLRQAIADHLWRHLPGKIKSHYLDGLKGMSSFLLHVGDHKPQMRALVMTRLKRLLARIDGKDNGRYELESFLKMLHKEGVLTLPDFSKALPNVAFIDTLVRDFKWDRNEIVRHIDKRMGGDLLRRDLGL